MITIEPSVFLIGETKIIEDGMQDFLNHIGVPNWNTDAPSDSEKLVETYGKLCYMSFDTALNPNLSKIRNNDNKKYIENIIKSGHGSCIEHCQLNFVFCDVSRVLTAELCRHRAGVAISEQSLRFCRFENINSYIPECIKENDEAFTLFTNSIKSMEETQKELAKIYDIDNIKDFHTKKELTSSFRRLVGMGASVSIGWSVNFRALRGIIERRTDPAAEEEIRLVFGKVYEIVSKRYPNLFQDYTVEIVNGIPWVKTENRKI